MDNSYSVNRNNRSFKWPVVAFVILVLLAGTGYLIFGSSSRLISPMPETPAVEIVFYTPTPEPATPTSSPSATPKITAKPKATVIPTKSITSTPAPTTANGTPTLTPKP